MDFQCLIFPHLGFHSNLATHFHGYSPDYVITNNGSTSKVLFSKSPTFSSSPPINKEMTKTKKTNNNNKTQTAHYIPTTEYTTNIKKIEREVSTVKWKHLQDILLSKNIN